MITLAACPLPADAACHGHGFQQECPKGGIAACAPDGVTFVSTAPGSVWEEQEHEKGRVVRVAMCPAGYALKREEDAPVNDACVKCERTSYRLEPAYVNSSLPHCRACDPKAFCPGGNVVESKQGYWRFQPEPWDETYEYLPGGGEGFCEGKAGKPCLFPNQGFVPMQAWGQQEMVSRLSDTGMRFILAVE
jgi:hypothetical protein